jgi:release factor glutamine methyltransferase
VSDQLTVGGALAQARTQGLDRLEAQLLLGALLGVDRGWLISHADDVLSTVQSERFADWLVQRLQDVPLAYLLGEKEFHGLRLRVNADTLVPRPDTEVLVDWALELLRAGGWSAPELVDLGTGSGAIALALKHQWPQARVAAVDLSAGALTVARANAEALGLAVEFRQGDWWQPLAGRRFELIVSNPPYIAGADPHLPTLRHEPLSALTPGGDGLSALQTLVQGAPPHLQPGGWLLLEHGYDQAEAVARLLSERGFEQIGCRRDLGDQPRVSAGRWPTETV